MSMWLPQGSTAQQAIVWEALRRCDFPFDVIREKLAQDTGKDQVPVEWADLAVWGARGHGEHTDGADPILVRNQVLGLAWYEGKVSLDLSLEQEPELAMEVFLSEGAHMVDFFYMSEAQRRALFLAFHGGADAEHGHGWFEETGNFDYYSWVGEAFMAAFVVAYSDIRPSLTSFVHQPPDREVVRDILTPYLGTLRSRVFHSRRHWFHKNKRLIRWARREDAASAGRRGCLLCRP